MADALLFSSPLRSAPTKLKWGYCDHASEPRWSCYPAIPARRHLATASGRRRLAQETRYQRIYGKETHYGPFIALHIFWVDGLVG